MFTILYFGTAILVNMSKKIYQGKFNDKEKSKQRLIEAVGTVIKAKGYTGLSASNISRAAGLDRRLITIYFGTLDTLIETYVRVKDFWLIPSKTATSMINGNSAKNTRQILDDLLQNQLDYFLNDEEMQKIVLWQISQSTQIMKEVCDERELLSQHFFTLSDRELKGREIDLRAVSALMVAGIYYLILHAKSTDSLFCEINLSTSDGMERIKKAISLILKKTYEE